VVRSLRDAPLVSGLLRFSVASVVTVMALGLMGLAMGAAAQAPRRVITEGSCCDG
jgi:putative ABC transport system permease protein